ncbi:methyltransferase [Frigoribacterium sp. 2-23]|uniref:methyltransferase n=1 Tax=Frigoribacterium sp. 2-23 TaxID=3415006 RepID=UPI003C6F100A
MSDQNAVSETKTLTDHKTLTGQTWVATGPAGVVGSINRTTEGFAVRLASRDEFSGEYPTLAVAKSALFASLGPGADYPEFSEH